MNTGNENPMFFNEASLFSQCSRSFIFVFDSVRNETFFLLLNISNSFSTLDFDAHIQTALGSSVNRLFEPIARQEQNTSYYICDLERTQTLTKIATYSHNPQNAGCYLAGDRSKFFYVEGSADWLYTYSQFISTPHEMHRSFAPTSINYQCKVISIWSCKWIIFKRSYSFILWHL